VATRKRKEDAQLGGADYPVNQPALAALPPLDIHTVSRISGITIGALNVQFARGIYPWLETNQQGRARRFDPNFAMHLALTGLLMDLGVSVRAASSAAVHVMMAKDLSQPGLKAVIGPIGSPHYQPVRIVQAQTLAEIANALGDDIESYVVIDLERLLRRFLGAAREAGGKTEPPEGGDR
jgi:hypothetical protein